MKDISRRDFLKAAGKGAAGAAGLSLVGRVGLSLAEDNSLSNPIYNQPASWDYETDVVTIGTGTSMYGVIKMAHAGLDVIAVDAFPVAGGSAAFSGGVLWLPNCKYSVERGDSREKAYDYVKQGAGSGYTTDELIYAFIDNTQPMIDYIDSALMKTSYKMASSMSKYPDYHPHWRNGMEYGRSILWTPSGETDAERAPSATATDAVAIWADSYIEAAKMYGAKIMTSTKMTKFVWRNNEAGIPEVLGVICEQDKKEIAIKARKAVLFAPGGFEWNFDMQKAFLAIPESYPCSTSTNDGTALKAAMALSPMLNNMANQFGHVSYKVKAKEQFEMKAPCNYQWNRHKPHSICVNKHGDRFFDEACDYPTAQKQFFDWDSTGDPGVRNLPAWLICDQQMVDAGFHVGRYMGDLDERGVPPYFLKANTLEEMADKCGINKERLLKTVERFNGFVEKGHDDDFNRGDTYFDQSFMADTSKEGVYRTLGSLEKGPFYAGELTPSTLGTCGGPLINGKAQVVHVSGQPVKRLYGCGNATGFGGPGQGYGGAGGTLGVGFTMGYVAGCSIVEEETANWE
ncbi:MAG: FAD-binding protein [Eubacteriales bacterium]|nr:FAD-binding protein [Eubacteriales bacterium]